MKCQVFGVLFITSLHIRNYFYYLNDVFRIPYSRWRASVQLHAIDLYADSDVDVIRLIWKWRTRAPSILLLLSVIFNFEKKVCSRFLSATPKYANNIVYLNNMEMPKKTWHTQRSDDLTSTHFSPQKWISFW